MCEHTFDPNFFFNKKMKNVGMIVWSGLLMDDLRIQALGKVKQNGLKFSCPNVLCDTRTLHF
jgi:hypothetical protein